MSTQPGAGPQGKARKWVWGGRTCLEVSQPGLGQRDIVCEEAAALAWNQWRVENVHLRADSSMGLPRVGTAVACGQMASLLPKPAFALTQGQRTSQGPWAGVRQSCWRVWRT